MGFWNGTDALTKLPIVEGEDVVLFVLVSKPDNFDMLSNAFNDAYNPLGLPFYGIYDGYGGITLDESKAAYHQRFMSSRSGRENVDVQEFIQDITEGHYHVDSHGEVYSVMFVKVDTWLALIEELGGMNEYLCKKTYRQKYNDMLDQYIAFSDKENRAKKDMLSGQVLFGEKLGAFGFWLGIMNMFADGVTEELKENTIRLLLTNILVRDLRIGWSPQFGIGSRDIELRLPSILVREKEREIEKLRSYVLN